VISRLLRLSWWLGLVAVMKLGSCGSLLAQPTNPPARLAILSETAATAVVSDLLTVELSRQPQLIVLERQQIEQVYREQGVSAGNKDYIKLGQVLGADGLLVLTPISEGTNQFMQVRLVAVKPGVIIAAVRSAWPVEDVRAWSHWLANHFDPLFPKLSVPVRDAIPVSVVNLRSAVRSTEAQETERQLTLLAMERLTRERDLFVLERRRMDLLTGEKDFQGMGDSIFWNGSYLLEGTIDRDGYSKERVTIHARLVPPLGGVPQDIIVSGRRTSLGEVSEQLARNILGALKKSSVVLAWKPELEAAKFYEEAKWAIKWGMIQEAQTASESAWALGQKDLDCALARVKSYTMELAGTASSYLERNLYISSSNEVPRKIQRLSARSAALAFEAHGDFVQVVTVDQMPEPRQIEQARHVLALYQDFSQTLPADELKAGAGWYDLGIETLVEASKVLQHFHFAPGSQKSVAAELAELRRQARAVAEWLSRPPSVRESYWIKERSATARELFWAIGARPNIFRCKVEYGCFWQERPEDCVEVYRELMSSPVFSHLHDKFCFRPLQSPRITAWQPQDRTRVRPVWRQFVEELHRNTNVLMQIEAKFLEMVDAQNEMQIQTTAEDLFNTLAAHRDFIHNSRVELAYTGSELIEFIERFCANHSPAKDRVRERLLNELRPKLHQNEPQHGAVAVRENEPAKLPAKISPLLAAAPARTQTTNSGLVLLVKEFLRIPVAPPAGGKAVALRICSHRVSEGKLLLDLNYWDERPAERFAAAIWNPRADTWEVTDYFPADGPTDISPFGLLAAETDLRLELYQGALYQSDSKAIKRFNSNGKAWQLLPLARQKFAQLFAVNGHLYATDEDSIFEIEADGQSTRLLASCRRRPVASILDSLATLERVTLFPGASNTLRAVIGSKVFTWNDRDWVEDLALDFRPQVDGFGDGIIMRGRLFSNPMQFDLCLLPNAQKTAGVRWQGTPKNRGAQNLRARRDKPTTDSAWLSVMPAKGLSLDRSPAAVIGRTLYLLERHNGKGVALAGDPNVKAAPHADLVCLDPDLPEPLSIPLRFDMSQGTLPGFGEIPDLVNGVRSEMWMASTPGFLIIGEKKAEGIWVIPQVQLSDAIAVEKLRVQSKVQNERRTSNAGP